MRAGPPFGIQHRSLTMSKKKKQPHHHHHHDNRSKAEIEDSNEMAKEEERKQLDRRSFLKGAAQVGLGGLALSPFAKLVKRAEVSAEVE